MTLVDKPASPSALAPDSALLQRPSREQISLSLSVGLVFLSTIAYAATPILAKLAYAHGGTPTTVALFRFVVGAIIFFAIWRFNHSPLKLTGSILVIGVVLGALYVFQALAYLVAVDLIPVGIAVVVVYLYPSFVALLAKFVDRSRIGAVQIICIAGAFLGVALATGTAPQSLNPLGVALAVGAAASAAIVIFFGGKLCRTVGSVPSCMLAFISAAVIIAAWTFLFGDIGVPVSPMGWVGVAGAGLTFAIGVLSFFTALKVLDSVRATIISNMEPLFAIMISFVALGEVLSPIQLAGVAFVLMSVILPSISATKGQRPA